MSSKHNYVAEGAIIGFIVGVLMHFPLIRGIILLTIGYFLCIFLWDQMVTESVAPRSSYEFTVTNVVVPDLINTRSNPTFQVETVLTNHNRQTIEKWILKGSLYECPRPFVRIDMCNKVGQVDTWVGGGAGPGETSRDRTQVIFWNNDNTHGQLRAVWSIGKVILDSDTDLADRRKEWNNALADYRQGQVMK